jgi:hypothetical protein
MAKVANIIAIYTKTRNIILEFQSLGNTIELFLILFPTLILISGRVCPAAGKAPKSK